MLQIKKVEIQEAERYSGVNPIAFALWGGTSAEPDGERASDLPTEEPAPSLARIEEKLDETSASLAKIESSLAALVGQRTIKDWYTPKEVADILGKKLYTVQEWCRLMRINAKKGVKGRGGEREWWISHQELLRIQNEGLLPPPAKY